MLFPRVNIKQLVYANTPRIIRREWWLHLQYYLMNSVVKVNDDYTQWAAQTEYDLLFDSQVIYLEHILNDMFDNINRTIYIFDGDAEPDLFFANINEFEDVPIFIDNIGESGIFYLSNVPEDAGDYDFIVYVDDIGGPYNEAVLFATVNQYKEAGKRWTTTAYYP